MTEDNASSTFSLPATQDQTIIYFIHPSENPTLHLISERSNGEAYSEWKRSMIIALSTKNKWAFINAFFLNLLKLIKPLQPVW